MDNIVHFLDANYVPIAQPVDTYSSLTYTPKWDEYGEFKFVSSPSLFASIKLAKRVSVNGKTFLLDNIKTKDASANNEMSVSGRTLEALLDKVVNPAPLRIRGNMEVQIRAIVTSLAITGLQAVTKLALGTLHGYQNSIDIVVPRGSLGLWLYTTLNQRGFSYTIEYDQASDSVLFDIVQEVDRSNDQTVNEPVIFSAQKGNIENVEYSKSDTDACNFAIVYDDETGEVVYVDESNGEEKRSLIVQGKSANTASDDSLYVMVGNDKRSIYTSTDSASFTLKYTFAADIVIEDVIYSSGLFIACGRSTGTGTPSLIYESVDAVAWSVMYTGSSEKRFVRVAYDDGFIVVIDRQNISGGVDATRISLVSGYYGEALQSTLLLDVTSFARPRRVNGFWLIGAETSADNRAIILRSEYGFEWEKLYFDVGAVSATSYIVTKVRDVIYNSGIMKAIGSVITPTSGEDPLLLTITSEDSLETYSYESFDVGFTVPDDYAGDSSWSGGAIAIGTRRGIAYSSNSGESFANISGYTSGRFAESIGNLIHVYATADVTSDATHLYTSNAVTWSTQTVPSLPDGTLVGAYGSSTHVMSMGDIGRTALADARSVEVIDGDVMPNVSPIIGTDCNVGDITSVVDINRGIIATKRLVAAQTVIEGKKHYTIPKFGTNYLSLTKYIKKEIAKNV